MVHRDLKPFLVAASILTDYAEIINVDYRLIRFDDPQDYYDQSMTLAMLRYINRHVQEMDLMFNRQLQIVRDQKGFEIYLLYGVAFHYCNDAYEPGGIIGCLSWMTYMSFKFYQIGYTLFPDHALDMMADVLWHYYFRGKMIGGFPGLYNFARTFLLNNW